MLVKVQDPVAGELHVPGLTIKFSETPGKIGPVPAPGQHADEILSQLLKYDSARIAALRARKVI
jgi:crotonobetainyl-CoA:carnitine CoA-transferase CaiB-like acyl-CoA transferase